MSDVKGLARGLAARCRELELQGLDAAAAEGIAFDELAYGATDDVYQAFLTAYAPTRRRGLG